MKDAQRGRPRRSEIDELALEHALALLAERGYDGLRMKDVAESAGVGLGALYRRWAGKEELITAALQADVSEHSAQDTGDPWVDLEAAVDRIIAAVPHGLGRLFAACLSDADSEWAHVARRAKLVPMIEGLAARLGRVSGGDPGTRRRAECAVAFLFWRNAIDHTSPTRDELLAIMEVTPHRPFPPLPATSMQIGDPCG